MRGCSGVGGRARSASRRKPRGPVARHKWLRGVLVQRDRGRAQAAPALEQTASARPDAGCRRSACRAWCFEPEEENAFFFEKCFSFLLVTECQTQQNLCSSSLFDLFPKMEDGRVPYALTQSEVSTWWPGDPPAPPGSAAA